MDKLAQYLCSSTIETYLPTWIISGFIVGILSFIVLCPQTIIFAMLLSLISIFLIKKNYIRIFLISFLFGIMRMYVQSHLLSLNKHINYGPIEFLGYVESKNKNQYKIVLNQIFDGKKYNYNIGKILLKSDIKIQENSTIFGKADLYPVSKPPFPGIADIRYKLFFNNILGYGKLCSFEVYDQPKLNKIKQFLLNKVDVQFEGDYRSFVKSILFGKKSEFKEEIKENFKKTGLIQLLCISGLHFALFSGLFYIMGRYLIGPICISQSSSLKNFGKIFSFLGILYYFILVDSNWSIIRTIIMSIIPIIFIFFTRQSNPYNSCIIALLFITLIWPYSILEPGLQLSFIAVFALLNTFKNFILSTIAVTLITTPYLLHSVGYASVQTVVSSAICVPFFSFIIMPLLVIGLVLCFPDLLVFLTKMSINLFLQILDLTSQIFIYELDFRINDTSLLIWSIALLSWILIRNRLVLILFVIIFLFSIKLDKSPKIIIDSSGNEIVFFDDRTVYSKDPESYFSKESARYLSANKILPIDSSFILNPNQYNFKDINVVLTGKKFSYASYKDQKILTKWEIVYNKMTPVVDVVSKKVSYV